MERDRIRHIPSPNRGLNDTSKNWTLRKGDVTGDARKRELDRRRSMKKPR